MSKKMRLWMAGTVGVLMAGFMSVSVYALEEKDVIGTWYVNELSMGEGASFHPGAMGMEVTVDIKEDGKMETTSSVYGEEPEVDESEWKIENDKILMTHNDQTGECEYKDGKITLTADGTTMILSQEKEEYEPYVPGKPVENPTSDAPSNEASEPASGETTQALDTTSTTRPESSAAPVIKESADGLPVWAYMVIAGGVVLLAGGGVLLYLFVFKKKRVK